MSIFTKWPRPAGLMLSKASFIWKESYACQWLDNVDMHTYAQLIKINHVVQELLAFLLTDHVRADRQADSYSD